MSFDIIVRFPDKDTAENFAAQMMDGFGEGYCDFSCWRQKEGTDGKKKEDFEHVFTPEGVQVYFVKRMFYGEDG